MDDSVDEILAQWAIARPELDVATMGVIGRLSRLTRLMERSLQGVFARYGLQPGEFDLLATLRRADTGGGLTAGELAASAMVTSGAITNRLDRLVAKELVTRDLDPDNRRTIKVLLTPRGRAVLDEALVEHLATEERLLAALAEEDRSLLAELLRRLLHANESTADGRDQPQH